MLYGDTAIPCPKFWMVPHVHNEPAQDPDDFSEDERPTPLGIGFLNWASILFLIYFLLCAIGLIERGFTLIGQQQAENIFSYATNPLAGVLVGILATALVQSSSVTTSIVVGFVAGGLPIAIAVPVVIGANFGTTLTNTFVSLGFARDRADFRRAFSAATVHDAFNFICLVIFLPLELAFGFLQKLAAYIGPTLTGLEPKQDVISPHFNLINKLTDPLVAEIAKLPSHIMHPWDGGLLIIVGLLMLVMSITFASQLLKLLLVGHTQRIATRLVGQAPGSGMLSGLIATTLLQSSSATTSLVIPLAGSGALTTKQVYPFTLGANIGTCLTAIVAAFAVKGQQELAFEIALIHLSYNLLGVLMVFSIPKLRYLPVYVAEFIGMMGAKRFVFAASYVAALFFLIPALGLFLLSL